MLYIYDILLNWNRTRLYDFFEWEKLDRLDHIKKIPLIRVDKGIINNFIYKSIKVDSDFISKEEDKILLGRFANPREVANLVEFLISDKASYINDSIIRIDGGIKC